MLSQPARASSQRSDSYGKPPPAQSSSARHDERDRYAQPSRDDRDRDRDRDRRQSARPAVFDDGYNAQAARHNSYGSSGARYDPGPPAQGGGGRVLSGGGGRAPAPVGGGSDRDALWPMFRAVDKGREF